MTPFKMRAPVWLFLPLIFSLILTGCERGIDPQTTLSNAKQHLEQKNPATAIVELKNVLQANPDLAEARFLLGKTYQEDGQNNAAETELRKAFALKYVPSLTLPWLAKSLLAQGKGRDLLSEFGQQKLHAADAQAEFGSLIGAAYLATGEPEKAEEQFAAAQKLIPDYPAAVLGHAQVLAAKKDFSAATTTVGTILAKDPKNYAALMFNGDLYLAQNQLDKAITAYEVVISYEPKNIPARLNLANTYMANGQIGAARAQLETLDKLAPNHPGVSYFHALISYTDKDYEKADESIQRTLLAAPDYMQGLLLAGTIEMQLNRYELSEQHLKRALAQAPNNLFIHKKIATLYLMQKDTVKAEGVLQSAVKLSRNDPELLALAGDIALANGQYGQASRYLGQATELNPTNSKALTQSALAQFALGNSEQAIAQLEIASKIEGKQEAKQEANTAQPELLLILAYAKRKEYDRALESWAALRKRLPDDPSIYTLQAIILLNKQDLPGARKALEHTLALDPTNFQAASNLAQLDLDDRKPDAARQRFRAILAKNKTSLDALFALANLERSLGSPKQEVVKLLNEARQGNPDSTQPVLALTQYLVEVGDTKAALTTINEALVAKPKNQQFLERAGMLQMRAGELTQAVATYTQLVADNPTQSRFLLRLAEAQVAAGKIEEAKDSVTKALQLKPDEADVQVAAVNIFLSTGNTADAQKMIEQIRTLTPLSPNLQQLQGDVRMAQGDFATASATYVKALSAGPTNGLLMKTHQALLLASKKLEAEAVLADWLKAHPDDMPVQMYAADMTMNSGDFAKAKVLYGNLLGQQPNNPLLLNNIAWVSLQLKDAKALSYAEKAYALAPANPDIADTFGWVLLEQGQIKRGIEILEGTNARFPKNANVKLHLAKGFIKDNRKEAARELLVSLVKEAGESSLGKEAGQVLAGL